MEPQESKALRHFVTVLSYILVAAASCVITVVLVLPKLKYYNSYLPLAQPQGDVAQAGEKMEELLNIIDTGFIGDADITAMADAAANAMVEATGDRWSYYISTAEMQSYIDQKENAYVGIGVTISTEDVSQGIIVTQVEPKGSAQKAGILPGDIIVEVEGQDLRGADINVSKDLIRGEVGTMVTIVVMRGEEKLTFTLERTLIEADVAYGYMLDGNVGYVAIVNFNEHCAQQTIALIEKLVAEGAASLLFDVRFNGGGYKSELVKVLDYLLPEGKLFHTLDYTGAEEIDSSDASCLKMPMAVLVNEYSFSAAEFFAAALEEYDWAVTVGERTVGKGYYQITVPLSDGSTVALSIGKYFTPKGVSLAETGGLVPNVEVPLDEETQTLIYAGLVEPKDDPQIQAALKALKAQ